MVASGVQSHEYGLTFFFNRIMCPQSVSPFYCRRVFRCVDKADFSLHSTVDAYFVLFVKF